MATIDNDLPIENVKSVFASLRVNDYKYLSIGLLGSAFALNMQLIAQGWMVYEMTSSAIKLTWVTLSFMIPQVVFSLLGGVLADRFAKKLIIGWAPFINGIATLFMALIIFSGMADFSAFLVIGFLNGTVLALSMPARTAFIPELVGEELIFNAMAFNSACWNLARIVGPAAAGFIIAIFADGNTTSSFGVGLVYVILSLLYFVSAVSVLFIAHPGRPELSQKSSALKDTQEALRYVVNSPIVGGLILLSILPFLFGLSINTLLPAFSTDVLNGGPDDLGLLMTGMGFGAILGSLALAKMSSVTKKGFWIIGTGALWGGLVAIFSTTNDYLISTIVIGFIGFVSAINMSMNRSVMQLQVAQSMRGRIMSVDMMSHGLMPLGILPIGYIAETTSVQTGLLTSGIALLLFTLLFGALMPQVRKINLGYK
ncbi:MAG: hypothetical protein CMQ39_02100 [Gammaproteobacteria bacterium]|nr:hypothetical protein [Gammaproteobacteria bacterium]